MEVFIKLWMWLVVFCLINICVLYLAEDHLAFVVLMSGRWCSGEGPIDSSGCWFVITLNLELRILHKRKENFRELGHFASYPPFDFALQPIERLFERMTLYNNTEWNDVTPSITSLFPLGAYSRFGVNDLCQISGSFQLVTTLLFRQHRHFKQVYFEKNG